MSKNKQDYDSLESQIGEMGGIQEETTNLGKLEHFGKSKEDKLSKSEKDELERFRQLAAKKTTLGKVQDFDGEQQVTSISEGWIPVNRDEMGIRSQFYPQDWTFYIRPATVQAIKNWTAIDEERPDVVNNVFNEIGRAHV